MLLNTILETAESFCAVLTVIMKTKNVTQSIS